MVSGAHMTESTPLLQVSDLSIRFAGVPGNLVDGVSLTLNAG